MKTTVAEGEIRYNSVKPHEAFEGQTPADAAGFGFRESESGSPCSEALTT